MERIGVYRLSSFLCFKEKNSKEGVKDKWLTEFSFYINQLA
ncbi:hypothetical protein GYO_2022 [Bacillus spizizenii TU-B-10]|uniref:Uncharacterized protein n=1 Tax=Bacillus spizizenii (strain DSM 15029 / JCM 12233 / NBRC 101239 / NRRL B-23049 / TU-B-10) TaxID=1052585 RepID=G4NV95_BACS4|nr:hypothetical protein GYO_2022 [Bacillus spizizenii TU-B-10]